MASFMQDIVLKFDAEQLKVFNQGVDEFNRGIAELVARVERLESPSDTAEGLRVAIEKHLVHASLLIGERDDARATVAERDATIANLRSAVFKIDDKVTIPKDQSWAAGTVWTVTRISWDGVYDLSNGNGLGERRKAHDLSPAPPPPDSSFEVGDKVRLDGDIKEITGSNIHAANHVWTVASKSSDNFYRLSDCGQIGSPNWGQSLKEGWWLQVGGDKLVAANSPIVTGGGGGAGRRGRARWYPDSLVAERLVQVVVNEGSNPRYHQNVVNSARKHFPTLWKQIDAIVADHQDWMVRNPNS